MDLNETMDVNGNVIQQSDRSKETVMNTPDISDKNNLLYIQAKLLEASSVRPTSPRFTVDFSSDSDEFSGDDLVTKEQKDRLNEERKRNLSQLTQTLDNLEKEETQDMLEAIESTFKRLQERAQFICESLENVQKKQQRVQFELKDNIDVVKEMRVKAQELLKKQDQIAKNYKNVESYILSTQPSDYQTTSSKSFARGRDVYSDESDDEYVSSVPTRSVSKKVEAYSDDEEEFTAKSTTAKLDDYSDEEPPKKIVDDDEEKLDEDDAEKGEVSERFDKYSDEDEPKTPTVVITKEDDDHPTEDEDDEEYLREQERIREEQRRRDEEFEEDERQRAPSEPVEPHLEDEDDYDEELARKLANEEIEKLKQEENE